MTRPLLEAEKALADAVGPARVEAEVALRVAKAKAEDAAKKAEQASVEHQLAAAAVATDAALETDSIRVPVMPQLVADDITPEAAASLLADQGGRLAVLSAEGGIFATLTGRYSGQPNFELFLKAHPGDMLRVTRKGRDAEDVDHPALTLGIATQPHTLTEIAHVPGFRDRGLIARFLWSLPENTVGRRKVGAPPPPAELLTTYTATLRMLVLTLAERPEPVELRLTPDAVDALVQLEEWVEPQLDPRGGALATITSTTATPSP
jgi:replicative DNA helicase